MIGISRIRLVLPARLAREAGHIARQVGESLGQHAFEYKEVNQRITVESNGRNGAQLVNAISARAGGKPWV
jgi:hypothetical protein